MASTEAMLQVARQIFRHGVDAVIPSNLIRNQVKLNGWVLQIQKSSVDLRQFERTFIVGFGKAVLPMAEELISIVTPTRLGLIEDPARTRIDRCILSIPEGSRASSFSQIEIFRGAKNNVPDLPAFEAAQKIVEVVQQCSPEDLLIVLISGGGSALLPYPRPPITLQEKAALFKQLSTGGATINELNSVRKAISLVKGGGLVRLCRAKRIVSLILSDVLGDKLDVIASGPTLENSDGKEVASQVVSKYVPAGRVAPNILQVLSEHEREAHHRDGSGSDAFKKVENIVLGNNTIALEACALQASKENMIPVILTSSLEGNARQVGVAIANLCGLISVAINSRQPLPRDETTRLLSALCIDSSSNSAAKLYKSVATAAETRRSVCIFFGGETTVNVKGSGRGGRNQELALSAAVRLDEAKRNYRGAPVAGNITILSGGTDGIDGPCEAAGAVVNHSVVRDAEVEGISTEDYLNNNDSFSYFAKVSNGKFHIVTGHTGTNVMDVVIAIIEHRPSSSL